MTLNDYTHHICDRFILLFIAFVGLVGTSYIIVSGNLDCNSQPIEDVGSVFQASFQQPIGIKQQEVIYEATTDVQLESDALFQSEENLTFSD